MTETPLQPEIGETGISDEEAARIRFLKRVVIVLGVLLIVGFMVVIATIVMRATSLSEPPPRADNATPWQANLPPDAAIVGYEVADNIVAVEIAFGTGPDARSILVLYDAASGAELGRIVPDARR